MTTKNGYLLASASSIGVYTLARSNVDLADVVMKFLAGVTRGVFDLLLPYLALAVIFTAIYLQMGGLAGVRQFPN